MRRLILLHALTLFIFCFVVIKPTSSQEKEFHEYQRVELSFKSDSIYAEPSADINFKAVFSSPSGNEIEQYGFWDGDSIYKIRFASPEAGRWGYRTICSDTANRGLHNRTGSIEVNKYHGNKRWNKRGWLSVSDNRRYLIHKNDSTPFFYLGDTAWEMSWKSTKEEITKYLDNRESKGFTAVQVVIMSHQRFPNVRNRNGQRVFNSNTNFLKINPEYFDYVDTIVEEINERDMLAVLVPLWAAMHRLHTKDTSKEKYLSDEEALNLAEYVGARYAGDEVAWIIGGDNKYSSSAQKEFWSNFAQRIGKAGGNRQLMTLHPKGHHSSLDYFDNTTSWIDFNMYHSSHTAKNDYTYEAALEGYKAQPTKPVINGEPCYEDIYHNLWQPGDTTEAHTFRIQPRHVRQAVYESVLSGSIMGVAYGANGIWQWHKGDLWASHRPRYKVLSAMHFAGSRHMGIMKSLLQEYDWHKLKPAPGNILDYSGKQKVMMAHNQKVMLMYSPTGNETFKVKIPENNILESVHFYDPTTGKLVENVKVNDTENGNRFVRKSGNQLQVTNPDTTDWVLAGKFYSDPGEDSGDFIQKSELIFSLAQNYPNPFNNRTVIKYSLDKIAPVTLKVYDITGKLIRTLVNEKQVAGIKKVAFNPEGLSSGVYIYKLEAGGRIKSRRMVYQK